MKRLLLFLAVVMILAACASNAVSSSEDNAPQDRKGWYVHELYGNVASVIMKTYDLDMKFGEETLGELESSHQYVFNEAGDVIKDVYILYFSSGDPFGYARVNVYDEKRNILETTTYDYEGEISGKYINGFDDLGNRISESYYGSDGKLEAKIVFNFNENGKCIARSDYDAEGVLETQYLLEYDERGNNVSEKVYAYDNALTKKILRKFNDNDKCVEYKEFEINAITAEVDLNRNRGKDISVEESLVQWYKFAYDEQGKNNERYELAADGTQKKNFKFSYQDGKLSEVVGYDSLGVMIAKEIFLRDRHGNIIERTEYEYKGPIEFPSQKVIYEIEYFE